MTINAKKTISYTTFIAADIAALLVTVAAVQISFYSPETIPINLLVGIWGILVPLAAGILTAALIVAISLLAAPVLACAWLVNELTSRSSRSHTVHAAYIPHALHSLGTLKPSGNAYWAGSGIADPEGNSVSLE